jgi:hypothetical protein
VVNLPLTGNFQSSLRWQASGLYFSHSNRNKNQPAESANKQNKTRAVNIYRLNMRHGTFQQLTHHLGIATQAFVIESLTEETADSEASKNKLFYLKTTSQGEKIYRLVLSDEHELNGLLGKFTLTNSTLFLKKNKTITASHADKDYSQSDYGFGPQSSSFALGGLISSNDNGLALIARGGDPLQRFAWQAAWVESSLQSNLAVKAKVNKGTGLWDNSYYIEAVQSDYLYTSYTINQGLLTDLKQQQNQINADISRRFNLSLRSAVELSFGLGYSSFTNHYQNSQEVILQSSEDKVSHYRIASAFNQQRNIGSFNYGYRLNALLLNYAGEQQNWQRIDYGLSVALGFSGAQFRYKLANKTLDDNAPNYALLNLGGQYTSASSQVTHHQELDPRLPSMWQQGLAFEQQSYALGFAQATLFYIKNRADDNRSQSAYGLQGETVMDDLSPLLDGLTVSSGVTWYDHLDPALGLNSKITTEFMYHLSLRFDL